MNKQIKTWIMATRPKTLPAAIAPVVIGSAMAYSDGIEHIPTAILCLLAALLIQIGTNFANDYFDFKKGTDTADRIGPTRVMQAGLVTQTQMVIAMVIVFGLAALSCYLLFKRGGTPILVIGIISILSGIFYTAGPKPLGYLGLGDIFVLIFFGPVAVGGTYYVQSFEINAAVIFAGFAPGLISTAILAVNNLRDIDGDRDAGKKTLAVRFGAEFARYEYMYCILTAGVIPVFIYCMIHDHMPIINCVVIILLAAPLIKTVLTESKGPALNRALAGTGKILVIYSILFSIGWLL